MPLLHHETQVWELTDAIPSALEEPPSPLLTRILRLVLVAGLLGTQRLPLLDQALDVGAGAQTGDCVPITGRRRSSMTRAL